MNVRLRRGTVWAAALFASTLAIGCQSPRLQGRIQDQERMIRQLRQENAAAEQRLREKEAELGEARGEAAAAGQQLASLSAELEAARAKAAEPAISPLNRDREELRRQLGRDADVQIRDGDLVITLPSQITFSSGSSDLSSSGRGLLGRIVGSLRDKYPNQTISIEGHTDDDPIRKSKFGTNWRLSVERAMAVRDYLEKQGGFSAGRFRVVGYGPYRPVASNSNPSGKGRNRRVEIVIVTS